MQIPPDILPEMGLQQGSLYVVTDVLWGEVETRMDEKLSFSLKVKPHSSFIFKIK